MPDLTEYQKWLEDRDIELTGGFEISMLGAYGSAFELRDQAVKQFGFAVLTGAAVEALRPYGPFLEVGAGSGYWTWELARRGVPCVATDPDPFSCVAWEIEKSWCDVERLDAKAALEKYPGRTLLSVWPSLRADWCAEALEQHRLQDGQTFVVVGEGYGGCTANDRLFDLLEEHWEAERTISIPQWYGIHDYVDVYRRK